MPVQPQLTFVPGGPVPAGGAFALWSDDPEADTGTLVDQADALGFPAGEPGRLATVSLDAGGLVARDVDARRLGVLPAVRRLAALPPGSDWPAWARPAASVLGWSVAAKLGLELVAAGRVLPAVRPTDDPSAVLAAWRVVAPSDPRAAQLAAAMPLAAHALRDDLGELWSAEELLEAFLDAVADACAREGRRPEIDRRRRGPRRAWSQMWADALGGSDPTVEHLRIPAEDLASDVADWAAPLVGRDRRAVARLALRLDAPAGPLAAAPAALGTDAPAAPAADAHTGAGGAPWSDDEPWSLTLRLQSTSDPSERVDAARIWERSGRTVELGGRRVEDPQLTLARGLATGARLFAPLDRALSETHPTGISLSPSEVAELITDGVDALAAAGIGVDVPPELRDAGHRQLRLRVRIGRSTPTAPRVDGSDPLGLGSVTDLHYEVALGDDVLSEDEFARIVALQQPLVRWRGQWVRVDHDEVDRIGQLAGNAASMELTEALAAALSGQHHVDDLGYVETVADGAIGELLRELRASDEPGEATIVGIDGELRPYQERGVAWLQRLTGLGMGGVLADQMGLGKTLQAMALLTSRAQDRPHLVVCPTSVVGNWERELARFAPGVPVVRHHGPDRAVTRRAFRPGAVVVTSYALLRRDVGMLEDVDWDVVVFDEAQQIKNPSSKGAQAARSLRARARIAMTGTPVENRLSELWSIVDVTNPGLLGSQRAFTERFAVPVERWHDDAAAARLRRLVAPFVLRRRKDDPEVSVDLPPKQELTVTCSLSREQASLYQATVDEAFAGEGLGGSAFERRGRILALLTALKQVCNHPSQYLRDGGPLAHRSGKLTRATEILGELVDDGDRALVFTQFREMGELLVDHLREHLSLPEVPFLHGGVPLQRRDDMVQRFQEAEDAPPLLVVSLRAGGTGLNLTRASHVLHFDRWWNPAVEDQATDRVHRIGQTRAVTVHTLVTAGTIEDRIAALLERKRVLADAVVGTGETWITELDDDELHELVALSTDDLGDDEDDDPPSEPPARPRLVSIPGGAS
jgi:superfamily II DNA or RNA helicase